MRRGSDIASAWNEDTPASDLPPASISRTISPTWRICTKRVRIEKYRPAPRHNQTSGGLHT